MAPHGQGDVTLADVLAELKSQGNKKKDWRESVVPIISAISALILGVAGLFFTVSYNNRQAELAARQAEQDKESKLYQNRVLEMQTVEKFVPYLTADENKKEIALLVITTLGSPEFATQFVKLNPSKGAQAAGDRIMASGAAAQKEPPVPTDTKAIVPATAPSAGAVRKSGWVYLGQYDSETRRWKTQYFNFADSAEPAKLRGTEQTVSARTGSINIRAGMPTATGQFPRVVEVLPAKSPVNVKSIQEWYTTGYMWAEVDYES